LAAWVLASGGFADPLQAQGVTTAAIRITVRASRGDDLEGTSVHVVNEATGNMADYRVHNGVLLVPGLPISGPYTVEVRRLGYVQKKRTGLSLSLDETRELYFTLDAMPSRLDAVAVTAVGDRSLHTAGGVGMISDSMLRRMPNLDGAMYDFVRAAPQVGTRFGLSGGGASVRLNSFMIDGVSDRNVQGNSADGRPTIPLDAVKEYQVLMSTFDARYGDFTGLLVNSVTKSGTNELRGSAYGYLRNARLARSGSVLGNSAYDRELYGFSAGGPIVKNRAHFFIATEIQRAEAPALGPYIGQSPDATPPVLVSPDSVDRFAALLRNKGLDPGNGGRIMLPNPDATFFGRVDLALPELKSRLVLRENAFRNDSWSFQRSADPTQFQLSSVMAGVRTTKQTAAVQLFSQLSTALSNEFLMGYTDNLLATQRTLSPSVQVVVGTVTLSAGPSAAGQAGGSRQRLVELGDHLVFQAGASHTIGMGARAEFFRYHAEGTRLGFGQWTFSNLDAIARGAPTKYQITEDFGSAEAAVVGAEPSVYVSDEWRISDRLSMTLGLRADGVSYGAHPAYNPEVDSLFQRRTSDYPSFRPQWSRRFGFVWEPDADRQTTIRGGAGIFVGRPPLGWMVGPMRSTGAGVRSLTCSGPAQVPAFTPYPAPQPTTCADGLAPTNGAVALVDHDLRMAESFRTSLALDRRLPWGVNAGVEALYSNVRSDFAFSNINLQGPAGVDPHGRVMYGALDQTGAHPVFVKGSTFTEVIDLHNESGGYSWSVTGQLYKPWSDHIEVRASYTYSRVRDVASVTAGNPLAPFDNWASERPFSGMPGDRSLGVSAYETPHRIVLSATYAARWKHQTTDVSLFYIGESGAPFTYGDSTRGRLSGDLNADGTSLDDPIYVPRNAMDPSEIVFAGTDSAAHAMAFERFIRETPCLNRQRGRIVERNSCRGPWVNTSNLSLRQSLPSVGGHAASMQLDVFNVLNLLSSSWGLVAVPNPWILQHAGQTTGATPQPKFTFDPDPSKRRSVRNADSAYQLQLSLRYSF
jgi:hypothetical protein